ncbi:hypothetical protein K438DRAFT_2021342 [Mycena galopus ATCC 62051]|nr:hypothetical protein K438DRAFT_2021342 [Mycena galopus ATCC 62051]
MEPYKDYESLLVKASKIPGPGRKAFQWRETWKTSSESRTPQAYALYIASKRRAKNPSYPILSTLYERAIADAARQRFSGEQGAEETLRTFWAGYCDTARTLEAGISVELDILQRVSNTCFVHYASNSAAQERAEDQDEGTSNLDSDIYEKALSSNLLQSDVEQLVPVLLTYAGYDKGRYDGTNGSPCSTLPPKQAIYAESADEDRLITMIAALETGIELVRKASPTGDLRLRLEKYLTSIYLDANMVESVIEVWNVAAKYYKTSYNAWISYTDALIKNRQHDMECNTLVDLHLKNLDWPEAIWEAWLAFNHLHGSVQQIDVCEKQAAQYTAEQMESVSLAQAPVPEISPAEPMDVDLRPRGTKRTAEDGGSEEGHKILSMTVFRCFPYEDSKPTLLKRANCTVFVADLPAGVTEEELTALFKDYLHRCSPSPAN